MDPRETNLPRWAQDELRNLRTDRKNLRDILEAMTAPGGLMPTGAGDAYAFVVAPMGSDVPTYRLPAGYTVGVATDGVVVTIRPAKREREIVSYMGPEGDYVPSVRRGDPRAEVGVYPRAVNSIAFRKTVR